MGIVFSCDVKKQEPLKEVMLYHIEQVDSLHHAITDLKNAVEAEADAATAQQKFTAARKYWKHIEGLSEFYFGDMSEFINGPALPEIEDNDAKLIEPTGFQVIEESLFPSINYRDDKENLLKEISILETSIPRLRQLYETTTLTDANVFEAVRLEILRVMSLGISGFDSPIAQQSLPEAQEALNGIYHILNPYFQREGSHALPDDLRQAIQFIGHDPAFNTFDRAVFIRRHLNKISEDIYQLQQDLQIPNNSFAIAVDLTKTNFSHAGSLHPDHFIPRASRKLKNKEAIAQLGATLFFDPIISGNNKRTCASCHKPSKAFSDGLEKSVAFASNGSVRRNAPSLINAGFQQAQFADSRVVFLEDQITDVVSSKEEMHGNMSHAVARLLKSNGYKELFTSAFDDSSAVNERNIKVAIATYIRSLTAFQSRFDQYMLGDDQALRSEEIAGFNLFMGKAKCATCHFMPLFNGTVPPNYQETESEVLGVPSKFDTLHATVDPDIGRFLSTRKRIQTNMFKTPTVRNVALTAPYMHNGAFATLEEVIEFYNLGGGAGIGINLDNQTLPAEKLNLTAKEKAQLVAFLKSLTDTNVPVKMPSSLPVVVDDKKLNARMVGGEY